MQCTRASPHRDSGTMSGLENSTELFNDLRSQQFLPEIITSFHHDSCPERDSDKNGGKKCTLHRPGKKRRKQKTHAVVGFTGGKKKHHFLVEMVPQQKSRKDGKLLYYWDLLRFIGFRQASVSSWHSGYRGMLPWPCPPWWQTGAQDTNRRKSLSSYKIRSRKNSREQTLIALIALIACKFVAKQPSPATTLPRSDAWKCSKSNVARSENEGESW